MLNKSCLFSLFLILIIVCGSLSCVSAVYPESKVMYVSPSGNDNNNGLTPDTAKRTIQSAIYALKCNGRVIISSGTYKENIVIPKRSNIELIGADKYDTVIDGQDKDICISISSSKVLVQNLMVRNGHAFEESDEYVASGGGVDIEDSEVTVKDCIITQNKADGYGGGIDTDGDTVLNIENSVVSKNTAYDGAGISNEGALTVKSSVIRENNAYNAYTVDSEYESGYGGGIYNTGTLTLISSVISKNKACYGGGICTFKNSVLVSRNTEVINNVSENGDSNIYWDESSID